MSLFPDLQHGDKIQTVEPAPDDQARHHRRHDDTDDCHPERSRGNMQGDSVEFLAWRFRVHRRTIFRVLAKERAA